MMKTTNITLIVRSLLALTAFLAMIPAISVGQESIRIENARINEIPPGIDVTAGYFEALNSGAEAVSLIRVTSPDFDRIEMHRSIVKNGIAKMEPQDAVAIAANSSLVFRPGDYHLMLYRPKQRLTAGDTVNLVFVFSDSTTLEAVATVRRPYTETNDHQHHQHH